MRELIQLHLARHTGDAEGHLGAAKEHRRLIRELKPCALVELAFRRMYDDEMRDAQVSRIKAEAIEDLLKEIDAGSR